MSDRYLDFTQSGFGKSFAGLLGLPTPPRLRRAEGPWAEQPLAGRAVLLGASSGAQRVTPILDALHRAGASLRVLPEHAGLTVIKPLAAELKLTLSGHPAKDSGELASAAYVFDASGIATPTQLRELYDFFNPVAAQIPGNARVLVIGRAPDDTGDIARSTCATALRGFVRSLAKELGKKGTTVNLLEAGEGAQDWLAAPMRFFLSEHSAFVTGQNLSIGAGPRGSAAPLSGSLSGKVALVTGAARGIGASIAQTLAREGARVIGMDHPSMEGALAETMSKIDGIGLALDVTANEAGARIADEAISKFGGLDIVVHNAGVTRDKMLRNMPPHFWDLVLNINLAAILRINEALLQKGLKDGARMVCIASIGGIAGNPGQTNYAATKAGVIGYADALASTMAQRGGAINAVAPGFIETQMTAQMPLGPREVGRRLSSLGQGGLPVDIAEAVAFLASPAAGGVNGRTLRVCGQSFVGA